MNIFSGSRRIATVAGALWVIGWLIAAAAHETTVVARYDIVGSTKIATFVGFNLFSSCPQKTIEQSLEFKTEAGHPINVTLCISGSAIYVPEGFVLDNPTLLLQDPGYINSDLETKKRLFAIHVAQSEDYTTANLATKKAIRSRFGISESDDKPFDPDAYLAGKKAEAELNARRRLAELEAKAAGKRAPAATIEELSSALIKADAAGNAADAKAFADAIRQMQNTAKSFNSAFKINEQEDNRLNQKWWESWRSAYGQGSAATLGGLAALWIFSMAMGWIVRGFMGIPRGLDRRP